MQHQTCNRIDKAKISKSAARVVDDDFVVPDQAYEHVDDHMETEPLRGHTRAGQRLYLTAANSRTSQLEWLVDQIEDRKVSTQSDIKAPESSEQLVEDVIGSMSSQGKGIRPLYVGYAHKLYIPH